LSSDFTVAEAIQLVAAADARIAFELTLKTVMAVLAATPRTWIIPSTLKYDQRC
jgi:hypothetical protein